MSFIDNEAELQAEHEAAKAKAEVDRKAIEDKKHEEECAERQKVAQIAREKRNAFLHPFYQGIVKAINVDPAFKATLDDDNKMLIKHDGYIVKDMDWKLTFTERYESGSMYSRRPAKAIGMQCTVGNYGERQTYPQKKNGTFSYHKIAVELLVYVRRQIAAAKSAAAQRSNSEVAAEFVKRHDLPEYYGAMRVSPSATGNDTPLFVKVEVSKALSVESAEKLVAVLQEIGLVKKPTLTVVK